MYCPSCGFQDAGDANFCKRCGTNLNVVASALSRTSGEKTEDELVKLLAIQQEMLNRQKVLKKRRGVLAGGIISTCVGVAMVLIMYLAREPEGPWPGLIAIVIGAAFILRGLLMGKPKPRLDVGEPSIDDTSQRSETANSLRSSGYRDSVTSETNRHLDSEEQRHRTAE